MPRYRRPKQTRSPHCHIMSRPTKKVRDTNIIGKYGWFSAESDAGIKLAGASNMSMILYMYLLYVDIVLAAPYPFGPLQVTAR